MKKTLLTISAIFFLFGFSKAQSLDSTIFNSSFDTCQVQIIESYQGDYVGGNNSYGDSIKLQKYGVNANGTAGMVAINVHFGYKTVADPNENVYAAVFAIDPVTYSVGNMIAITDPVTMANIDTTNNFTVFNFPGSIQIPDSFFVGVILPLQTGDTVAISSTGTCANAGYLSWETEQSGASNSIYNNWGINTDFWIFPVINFSAFPGAINETKGERLFSIYPNPAARSIKIFSESLKEKNYQIEIRDIQGRNVYSDISHRQTIDISDLAPGVYFVVLKTKNGNSFQKLIVE